MTKCKYNLTDTMEKNQNMIEVISNHINANNPKASNLSPNDIRHVIKMSH